MTAVDEPQVAGVTAGATGAHVVDTAGAGVATELQDVETLVKTGTETVQGQSVMVKVVAVLIVQVLPKWTMVVGSGT